MNLTNEIVATELMEWKYSIKLWHTGYSSMVEIPDFLHDLNAAKLVIDKMRENGWLFRVDMWGTDQYLVSIFKPDWSFMDAISTRSESLCHAICAAAMKAIGVSQTHEDSIGYSGLIDENYPSDISP